MQVSLRKGNFYTMLIEFVVNGKIQFADEQSLAMCECVGSRTTLEVQSAIAKLYEANARRWFLENVRFCRSNFELRASIKRESPA